MKQTKIKCMFLAMLIVCGAFCFSFISFCPSINADETGPLNSEAPALRVYVHLAGDTTDVSTVELDMQDALDPNSDVSVSYRTKVGETVEFRKEDFRGLLVKGLKDGEEQTVTYDGTNPSLDSAEFKVILTVRGPDELEKQFTIQVPIGEVADYEVEI